MKFKENSLPKNSERLIKALRYVLLDFKNDLESWKADNLLKEKHISFPRELCPPTYLVFFAFVSFLDFAWFGREEKILWKIPVSFKGIPFLISHGKFGFCIHTLSNFNPNNVLIKEMLIQIKKAAKITDILLKPYIQERFNAGQITIANSYIKLSNMYNYFRTRATLSYQKSINSKKKHDNFVSPISISSKYIERQFEGFYNTVAMMDAFYSRLENLLVFAIPFIGFPPEVTSIETFISLPWAEKYKHIYNMQQNKNALACFKCLREIKEKYRNPISHGFFQKDNASIFVQFPLVGAIPLYLDNSETNISLSMIPISEATFDAICKDFDSTEEFLRSSKLKYAIRYAEEGFDIAFDDVSIKKYKEACSSDENFANFIEKQSYIQAMYDNMDW